MTVNYSNEFQGFGPEGFDFFRRLTKNNNKAWLDQNRAIYEKHVVGTLRGLFDALAPTMLELHPDFEVSGRTGKNLSRINRDVRFARDKSPYRHNLYLYFAERGTSGRDARLYVGLSADGITCGFASYHRPRGTMDRLLKPRRAREPQLVEYFLRRISRRYDIYWHGKERGQWVKHAGPPRSEQDWKRAKALVIRKLFAPQHSAVSSSRFVGRVEKIFWELFPLFSFAAFDGSENERPLRQAARR